MPIPWNQVSQKNRLFAAGAGGGVGPQQQRANLQAMQNGTFQFNPQAGAQMGQSRMPTMMPNLPQQYPQQGHVPGFSAAGGGQLASNPVAQGGYGQGFMNSGLQNQTQLASNPVAPQLRVSSPNAAPGMAQHLSDLLSQRNQQTALDLTRQGAYANAQHGLQAQQARSRAGLGWAGVQSSDQLAAMQNQMDIISAIIRMLGNPFADLGF